LPGLSTADVISIDRHSVFVTAADLQVETTTDPRADLVDVFFDGYDRSFVLPNEKEELAGFRECLTLNFPPHYERLRAAYGPFREIVLIARAPTGTVIGGANFICFPLDRKTAQASEVLLAMNLNYLYVLPEHRRRGYFGALLEACQIAARRSFQFAPSVAARSRGAELANVPLLVFLEQNDPMRMDPADYAKDTEHSGLDQVARIAVWTKMGARIVDFPYVQPPLSDAQEADRNLVLAVLGAGRTSLDPCVLRSHFARFFGISVLKGRSLESNAVAWSQLEALRDSCRVGVPIPLLDATPWLARRLAEDVATDLRHAIKAAAQRS
jgi:GNAT superfamily N-acetyltransferase